MHGVADGGGGIDHHIQVDRHRQGFAQGRQVLEDRVHHLDHIGARLLGDLHQHGGLAVEQAQIADILHAIADLGHVLQPHRRAIAICDDQGLIVLGKRGAVIGIDLEGLAGLLDVALGAVGIGGADRGAHIFQADAVFVEGAGIELDADGRRRGAVERDIADARNLRQLLLDDVAGLVVDLPGRQGLGGHGQDQDGKVGRIELAVGGVGAQPPRQVGARGIDRGLHVTGGAVDVAVDVELQHDLGGIDVAARRHLGDAGNGAQMPLQRRRHAGRHGFGRSAGLGGADRDGGNVDIGQRRHGQQEIGAKARQAQT